LYVAFKVGRLHLEKTRLSGGNPKARMRQGGTGAIQKQGHAIASKAEDTSSKNPTHEEYLPRSYKL
jgi:hypothetical protein